MTPRPGDSLVAQRRFSPFATNTDYFGRPEQKRMINFRVAALDAMTSQLEKAGTAAEFEGNFPNGRFARLTDPEGYSIQIW